MKFREMKKMLKEAGWTFSRQKGSHQIYKHPDHKNFVLLAAHSDNDDIKAGTANSILKQAGIKK